MSLPWRSQRFMVMALASKENTCKKTGVSATRDVGDAIVCAAMHVLLLCAAFESCRSSVKYMCMHMYM